MARRHPAWNLVALLCATATAGYLCRVNASTAGALLMHEFGLSQVAMGRVFSAFLLGYALCMVPAGAIADRWGARRVLTVAAWSWTALTLLQALVGWGPFAAVVAALAAWIGWEHALHVAAVLAVIAALLWLGIEPAGGPHDDKQDVATVGRAEASH